MATHKKKNWRSQLHDIIYEADTKAGKWFDIFLMLVILISIVVVMLESVDAINAKYHVFFNYTEWIITILFTLEYIARIISIKKPRTYIFSFYGMVDLLSTLPKYLSLLFGAGQALVVIRILRLMRVFRVLKLARYIGESENLIRALRASRAKILVFLMAVITLATILGTMMYLIEGGQDSGFDSIPRSVYWAIVTLTTVGYGDIAPVTSFGQLIASCIMILGYSIIAIPTGIVAVEYGKKMKISTNTRACVNCNASHHKDKAKYCYECGEELS